MRNKEPRCLPWVGAPGFADARGYAITSSLRTITCARGDSADSRPHHVRHKRAALSRTRRCRVASSSLPCQPNNSSQLWLASRRARGCIPLCRAHHNALQLSSLRRDGPSTILHFDSKHSYRHLKWSIDHTQKKHLEAQLQWQTFLLWSVLLVASHSSQTILKQSHRQLAIAPQTGFVRSPLVLR